MRHEGDLDLVTVLATSDLGLIDIAEGLLEGAGILFLAKGEGVQDLFGLGRLTAVNPITGPVEIQVNAADAESARQLLEDLIAEVDGS
ncbi:MAG: DUF2007 domain-containing protein [Candidatus Krumholzibacteriia bacterium]